MQRLSLSFLVATTLLAGALTLAQANPLTWQATEWPETDFAQHSIDYSEIRSGGPPKDGIPSIDEPVFETLADAAGDGWSSRYEDREPVISVEFGGDARAYPLSVLMWHEIVNDTVGGLPLTITYCPLCNASLVFERKLDGEVLDFGTTGKLRKSDLVMYDRQSESWWQQFTGEAIVGEKTGAQLKLYPARLESFAVFKERRPNGIVLIPNNPSLRDYGRNPYRMYDAPNSTPFLFDGDMPPDIEPMARVVAVETGDGHAAWPLSLLRERGVIIDGDLKLEWTGGRASALDSGQVAHGRDVGNVVVQRIVNGDDRLVDVPYDVTFAFAFHAFRPESPIHRD